MPKIPESFNFGSSEEMKMEDLIVKLERMYYDIAKAVNKKPDLYERNVDGQTSDTFMSNGDININNATNKVEMISNHPTKTTVTWVTLS